MTEAKTQDGSNEFQRLLKANGGGQLPPGHYATFDHERPALALLPGWQWARAPALYQENLGKPVAEHKQHVFYINRKLGITQWHHPGFAKPAVPAPPKVIPTPRAQSVQSPQAPKPPVAMPIEEAMKLKQSSQQQQQEASSPAPQGQVQQQQDQQQQQQEPQQQQQQQQAAAQPEPQQRFQFVPIVPPQQQEQQQQQQQQQSNDIPQLQGEPELSAPPQLVFDDAANAAPAADQQNQEEMQIQSLFNALDADGNGSVSFAEISRAYPDTANEIMKIADVNQDGNISYSEFARAYRGATSPPAQQSGEIDVGAAPELVFDSP